MDHAAEGPPPDDVLLTPKRAAQLARVSPSTIYKLIASGKLPYWKKRSGRFVTLEDVLRLQTTRPGPPPAKPAPKLTPELLTAKQVGELLSVSTRTVWRMLERGELPPPIRTNRKLVRWHQTSVLRHIDELAESVKYGTY
jgi:excisionase family DNA binding protein